MVGQPNIFFLTSESYVDFLKVCIRKHWNSKEALRIL